MKPCVILSLGLLLLGCARIGRAENCDVCLRPLQEETVYRIHLRNGETKRVCCPRCGLHFQDGRSDVTGTEVTDYPSGEMLGAAQAFFVEGSSVMPCCTSTPQRDQRGGLYELSWDRCMPSLIAFRRALEAENFRSQHGGSVKTYSELMLEIKVPPEPVPDQE